MSDRFWAKVNKSGDCWLWTGALSSAGYGSFRLGNSARGAHRVAWELLRGAVPEGMEIDHLCRVRHCVNIEHMEPVSHWENTHRGETLAASTDHWPTPDTQNARSGAMRAEASKEADGKHAISLHHAVARWEI